METARFTPVNLTPFPPVPRPAFPNGTDPEITGEWVDQVTKAARERSIAGIRLTQAESLLVIEALSWMAETFRGSHSCDEQ